jgi:enoyl-CoA hydratase/carnithine racemase
MTYFNILVASDAGGVACITLNRPDRRNALSLDLLTELEGALRELGTDTGVGVVVLEGAGPSFSAGHDLTEMIDREPAFYSEIFNKCTSIMLAIQQMPQPVIAKVHGMATAAGCQLVAACDLAVAADDSWFATPGVRIGLFCSTPLVPLTRAIGRKRALEMLLTGEPIDAATAHDWGLVNRVVARDALDGATQELAGEITRFSRDIIAIGKAAFYGQIGESDSAAYEITTPIMSANAAHPDAQEGMSAFLEKRPPRWIED